MDKIYYNKLLKQRAQELRRESTYWENCLWYQFLKHHPVQFRRQKQFGRYIVDFLLSDLQALSMMMQMANMGNSIFFIVGYLMRLTDLRALIFNKFLHRLLMSSALYTYMSRVPRNTPFVVSILMFLLLMA